MASRSMQIAPPQAGASVAIQSQQQVGEMRRWAVSQQDANVGAVGRAIPSAQAAPAAPASMAKAKMAPQSASGRPSVAGAVAVPQAAPITATDGIASNSTIEVQASNADLQTMNASVGLTVDPSMVGTLMALPGGKQIVSSVVVSGRRLSVNAAGDLYVSQDGGATWRKIRKQWKGKATSLAVVPMASTMRKDGGVVLLTNERQATWRSVSAGETWEAGAQPDKP